MKKEQIKKEALNTNYVKPNAQAIISKIDDIAIGDNKGSNQRISTTNLIIASIKKGDFVLEYKKKKTNKLVKFSTLNRVNNEDFRGFIESFKIQLGVNNLPTWQNKTDEGKARMRILRDVFIVALPLIKADAIDTDDKGNSLTGANDSKLLLKGAFVKENYQPLNKDNVKQVALNFNQLKTVAQNYYKENNFSNDVETKNTSFEQMLVRTATVITEDMHNGCESNENFTHSKMVALATACNNWCRVLKENQLKATTPEQRARIEKKATA